MSIEAIHIQNFDEQKSIYNEKIDRHNKLFQYLVLLSR